MGDDCSLTTNYVVMFEHSCQTLPWLLLALLWAGGHPHQFAGQVVLTLLKLLKEGKPQPLWAESMQIVRSLAGSLGRRGVGTVKEEW